MNSNVAMSRTRLRRVGRVRSKLARNCDVRLSVHASGRHIYAQIINDIAGVTIVSASSCDKAVAKQFKHGGSVEVALVIGRIVAERALAAGVSNVVFDRGGRRYHGRVAAVANAAREIGLLF